MNRRYLLSGVIFPLGLLIFSTIIITFQLAKSYDGKCGGYLPWLAGAKPCSFWEFVSGNLQLLILIAWSSYWPLILAFLFLPASLGYLIDKRLHQRAAKN